MGKRSVTGDVATIMSGQRWRVRGDNENAYWTVMSLAEDGKVGLSGPGPCRAYQVVEDEVLLRDWERISG